MLNAKSNRFVRGRVGDRKGKEMINFCSQGRKYGLIFSKLSSQKLGRENIINRLSWSACLWNKFSLPPTASSNMDTTSAPVSSRMSWSPQEARQQFRSNPSLRAVPTSGFCSGHMQANIAIIPSSLADDFEEFCRQNQGPCPVLYRSKTGEVGAPSLAKDSDIRTDLTQYKITNYCSEGSSEGTKTACDLTNYSWEDMVTFYVGCSFSFENAMINAGIPLQNIQEKRNVSMFKTNIKCYPVGPFSCSKMIVSMRPVPKHLVEKTVAVTAAFDAVHGAPIHIGNPAMIGISDVTKCDFGDPSYFGEDHIPVFWACGVTTSEAIKSAKPPICFSHSPGCMFICDTTVNEYFTSHKAPHGDEQPRVVILQEEPYFASVVGSKALEKIDKLETIIQEDPGERGIKHLHIPNELVKGALRVSHAASVAIVTGFPFNLGHDPPDETDGPPGALSMAKTFQALGKKVTLIASHYNSKLLNELVKTCVDCGILQETVSVATFQLATGESSEAAAVRFLCPNGCEQSPRFDVLVATEAVCRNAEGGYRTSSNKDLTSVCADSPVDELFIQANKSGKVATVGIGDGGNEIGMGKVQERVMQYIKNGKHIAASVSTDDIITAGVSNWGSWALAMAVFLLHECTIHSRYLRHGIGKHHAVSLETAINSVDQERRILEILVKAGVCDGLSGKSEMSVDGLSFDPVHVNKLMTLLEVID